MTESRFGEPKHWPYRLIIFGDDEGQRPEAIMMRAFKNTYSRDAYARDWTPKHRGQTAIAVTVDYVIAGGDEPKR